MNEDSMARLAVDYNRIRSDLADSFDEEFEVAMDEERLDRMLFGANQPSTGADIERGVYFRELFRLQRELVRLQHRVPHAGLVQRAEPRQAVLQRVRAQRSSSTGASIR